MKRIYALPIRSQLLIIILIIALPAIFLIIVTGIQDRSNAIKDAYRISDLLAERIASEQRNRTYAAEQLLFTLAQIPGVREKKKERLEQLLKKIQSSNPEYANILAANLDGKVWASVFELPPPAEINDRRYFKNALSSGKLSSGEYVQSKSLNKPVLHFAYPYLDISEKTGGVISVAFYFTLFEDILKNRRLPDGTSFLLIDHNGIIMFHPLSPESVGRHYPVEAYKRMYDDPDKCSYRGKGNSGKEFFITYKKIRLETETAPYMYIRVGVPVSSVLATANRTLIRNISILSFFLTASFLLAYLVGKRSIADRIKLLQNAAHKLADGEQQIIVSDSVSGGELGSLAESFDKMALNLVEREQIIKESEARLRSITDSALDGILMIDKNEIISFWNPAAEKILGYSIEEAIGKTLHELLAPKSEDDQNQAYFPFFCDAGKLHLSGKMLELDTMRKDGQEITISILFSSVVLYDGYYAVGILRDITDWKRYQDELIKARHSAEAANRAKSEFLANMSHEIRTPMNGVLGMTQLLRFTETSAEQKEYLESLEQSCKNLLELINDILDLSKIEAGKLELEETDFSPIRTVREVIDNQSPRIKLKGLKLTTNFQEPMPKLVRGDSLRFKQILLNILGNAIKFTEKGTINISFCVSNLQQNHCTLKVTISDTGIGIAPETVEKIFNPFEQADNSTTRIYGGSGLGLTICRRLVTQMNGKIWADSKLGEGSTFVVEIPFAVRIKESKLFSEPVDNTDIKVMDRELNLLVAEDSRLNAKTIKAMLHHIGHQADVAVNGQQALDMLHKKNYDCILMDISMPVMDGSLATETIRKQEAATGGHIPIIALTANALLGDRERFLAQGFDGYISKPVDIKHLSDEIIRVISESNN